MELYTLDSSFQLNRAVENYEALIWTERYSTAGDFQITTNDIGAMIQALPLESYIGLRESTVPMMVENYKIEKKAREAPLLTVTGRSFEACALERRLSVSTMPTASARAAWTLMAATASDAAYKAMRVVLGDVARSKNGSQVLEAIAPALSPLDAIPQIDLVLPADYSTESPNSYEIQAGYLYTTVLEMLAPNNRGIKSYRPGVTGNKVGVEIYNGANLTEGDDAVVFDAMFDQFDNSTYLFSEQGSTNVGYVYGINGSQKVLKTADAEPSGLARRLLLSDYNSDATVNTATIRNNRGLIDLYQNNKTALFTGEISDLIATGYNQKYFLGDILRLVGEYGLSQNVRVEEFIRTSDKQGTKAYPAFEAIEAAI